MKTPLPTRSADLTARLEGLRRRFGALGALVALRVAFYVVLFGSVFLAPTSTMGMFGGEGVITAVEVSVGIVQFVALLVFLSGAEGVAKAIRPRPVVRGMQDDLVVSFFLPFVNFYRPPKLIADLITELVREAGGFRGHDGLVAVFWCAWILHSIANRFVDATNLTTTFVMLGLLFVLLVLELVLASTLLRVAREAAEHQKPDGLTEVFE